MNTTAPERINIEQNLSMVLGRPVRLSSPEIRALTRADLKRAYFRKAKETHPDRAASIGIASSILEERFRLLQNAYDIIQENWESLLDEPVPAGAGARAGPSAHTHAGPTPRTKTYSRPQEKPRTSNHESTKTHARAQPGQKASNRNSGTETEGGRKSWGAHTSNTNRARRNPESRTGAAHAGAAGRTGAKPEAKTALEGARILPPVRLRLGEYLYYTGRIDWSMFFGAISWQMRNRPKIGDIALSLGLLDHPDIISIIRHRKRGELFGQAAVRLGFLESYDIMILCGRQRLLDCPIGKYFVEEGILSENDLAKSLDGLARHNLYVALRSRKPL